jgi:hypothetical protein
VKTCECLKNKKEWRPLIIINREKTFYILPQAKSCEKGEKNEQVKVAHWNPTCVVKKKRNKKGPKPCYSMVRTCEGH